MCGFFVVKNKIKNKNIDIKKLINCTNLINHRGPDDKQNIFIKNTFFGFRRLSILDLTKKGRQPMYNKSRDKLIVYNGEIYNALKLKELINSKNLNGTSDTEILLELYEKYGVKCLDKIKGMFAFVIYDLKKETFFIARDQFGIKPIYYYDDKNVTIFSSEIKPIIHFLGKINFNYLSFANFLLKGKLDHYENTFFENIKSLEPANFLISNGKFKKKKYWSINTKSISKKNSNIHINNLEELIDKKLDQYLIADRKISVFLSGGSDSTSLSGLIAKKINYKLETFTYDFKNNYGFGESYLAKINSKFINASNNLFELNSKYVVNNFDKMSKMLESPFTSIRLFAIHGLYNLVNEKKYKVVIEGAGGDEILGGYSYNLFPKILDESKSVNNIISKFLDFSIKSKKDTEIELLNRLITLNFPSGSTTDATPYINIDFFSKDFLNNFLTENFYKLEKKYFSDYKKMNNLKKSQIQDIQENKLPRNLKFTDRLSMVNGIETRLPFLDVDIAKYCFNLHNNYKINNGVNRWILKKVLNKKINKINLNKEKISVADPQTYWFKSDMKDYILDNFKSTSFNNLKIFNTKKIIAEFEKFCNEENPTTSFQYMQILSTHNFVKNFKKFVQ